MKHLMTFAGMCIVLATALLLPACNKDSAQNAGSATGLIAEMRSMADSKVFPPSANPYGKSYAEWTVEWLKEFVKDDCSTNAWLNPGDPLFYENGPVYFMAGIAALNGSADVTVPHGKAILFPLTNYINDFPCPDPTFQPEPGQTMEDFLTLGAQAAMSSATNLSVTIDGNAVTNPSNYLFTTSLFYFEGNADLANCFDACITGDSQPGVGCGYYMMLKPLAKGTHTIHYHSEIADWGFVQDATFNVTVQ